MSAFSDKRRDVKRAYRKKAFQTDMSLISNTVDNTPPPPHSYSSPSHQETTPMRKGIDPHIYIKGVRPAVESLDVSRMIDTARFPWHLYPKGDSANVIARAKYAFSATTVSDDDYVDVLVLNVADVANSQTPGPAAIPGPAPSPAQISTNTPDGAQTGGGNPSHPNMAGNTITGISGSVNIGAPGEVYSISSFGHSEISTANQSTGTGFTTAAPLTYQIWVDGTLFMEWVNFQWSPVTPLQDQWHFKQPITVTEQIVFRIINETGEDLTVGDMESCFNGWSEPLSGYVDTANQQLQPN